MKVRVSPGKCLCGASVLPKRQIVSLAVYCVDDYRHFSHHKGLKKSTVEMRSRLAKALQESILAALSLHLRLTREHGCLPVAHAPRINLSVSVGCFGVEAFPTQR